MVYLFYDFETNGISPTTCGIMQMAVMNEEGTVMYNYYMYPYDGKIDAVEIHGIDENVLKEKNARKSEECMIEMMNEIKDIYGSENVYWIAYNNFGYDQIVMESEYKRMGVEVPRNWYFLDLFPCVKELYPNIKPNYKLQTVYEYMMGNKKKSIKYHCALGDTSCLYEMYEKMKSEGKDVCLRDKYCRSGMGNGEIMEAPISTMGGYCNKINYRNMGFEKIRDIYNKYVMMGRDVNKMTQYLKNECNIRVDFYVRQMVDQIAMIDQYQTRKRKDRDL